MGTIIGISTILTIAFSALLIRHKAIHHYLDLALELKEKQKTSTSGHYKKVSRESKHKAYWFARYERIKNAEALSNIPPHFSHHIDGSDWHNAKISKCYIAYFSGLENRYICLLLDKHDTATSDSLHAKELKIPSDTWLTTNRAINKYDEDPYIKFIKLSDVDLKRLRLAGIQIMRYKGEWISELNLTNVMVS